MSPGSGRWLSQLSEDLSLVTSTLIESQAGQQHVTIIPDWGGEDRTLPASPAKPSGSSFIERSCLKN